MSSLEDLVEFLVLDDLVRDFPALRTRLMELPQARYPVPGVSNIEANRAYRLEHQFVITGEARQRDRAIDGPELGRVAQSVMEEAAPATCQFLVLPRD